MIVNRAHLVELLSMDSAAEPPKEVRLFKAGVNITSKGQFNFTAQSAKSVMQAYAEQGVDLPFDYEHASHDPMPVDPALSSKAAGWFKLEVRNQELWATDIRWTPAADKMLRDREFRYLSPAFSHTKAGEILKFVDAAICNHPATKHTAPLLASAKDHTMEPKLIALLGLKDDASADEAIGAIAALKASASKVAELHEQIKALQASARSAEVDALIRQAGDEGKLPPSMVEWAKAQSPETLKGFLSAAPKLVITNKDPAGEKPAAKKEDEGSAGTVKLTAQEKTFAAAAGVSEEDAIKRKTFRLEKASELAKLAAAADSED